LPVVEDGPRKGYQILGAEKNENQFYTYAFSEPKFDTLSSLGFGCALNAIRTEHYQLNEYLLWKW
jgi:hypothetical protein